MPGDVRGELGPPDLPKALHPVFIEAVRSGRIDLFRVPDKEILLGRYSMNAIGFFGADKLALGEAFYADGAERGGVALGVLTASPTVVGRSSAIRGCALQLLRAGILIAADRHSGGVLRAGWPATAQLREARIRKTPQGQAAAMAKAEEEAGIFDFAR